MAFVTYEGVVEAGKVRFAGETTPPEQTPVTVIVETTPVPNPTTGIRHIRPRLLYPEDAVVLASPRTESPDARK